MGDSSLSFAGQNRKAPVLDWSAYFWADGNNPRKDGYSCECPTDLKVDDGLHWSTVGNEKAGRAIFERFYTDQEAMKWFLNPTLSSLSTQSEKVEFEIYSPQGRDYFRVKSNIDDIIEFQFFTTQGSLIKQEKSSTNELVIHQNLPQGVYLLTLSAKNNKQFVIKIMIEK